MTKRAPRSLQRCTKVVGTERLLSRCATSLTEPHCTVEGDNSISASSRPPLCGLLLEDLAAKVHNVTVDPRFT